MAFQDVVNGINSYLDSKKQFANITQPPTQGGTINQLPSTAKMLPTGELVGPASQLTPSTPTYKESQPYPSVSNLTQEYLPGVAAWGELLKGAATLQKSPLSQQSQQYFTKAFPMLFGKTQKERQAGNLNFAMGFIGGAPEEVNLAKIAAEKVASKIAPELSKIPGLAKEGIAALSEKLVKPNTVEDVSRIISEHLGQATKGIPKELEGLAQEARKYKSADEFIAGTKDFRTRMAQELQQGTTKIRQELGMSKEADKQIAKLQSKYNVNIKDFYTSATKGVEAIPKVVYHGTPYSIEGNKLVTKLAGTGMENEKNAIWFTDNPTLAKKYTYVNKSPNESISERMNNLINDRMSQLGADKLYEQAKVADKAGNKQLYNQIWDKINKIETTARETAGNPNVYQAELNLKNPLIVDNKGKFYNSDQYRKWINQARKEGRDGLIIKNTGESEANKGLLGNTYAVFKDTNISLSATKGVEKVAPKVIAQVEEKSGALLNKPPIGAMAERAGVVSNALPEALKTSPIPPPAETVEQKLINILQEKAGPTRALQEKGYTVARAGRFAQAQEVAKGTQGEAGLYQELGKLKGSLPKQDFEAIRSQVTDQDVTALLEKIKSNPELNYMETVTGREALVKMFDGTVPTEGELKILKKTFNPDLIKAIESKRSLFKKAADLGVNLINIPKSLMSSGDFSAPLRQGLFLAPLKPKLFMEASIGQVKYFASENAYKELESVIRSKPSYELGKEAGLSLTDIGGKITQKEEQFISNWGEKIPVIGKMVRGSDRAFTGMLNKSRADIFDSLINDAMDAGVIQAEKGADGQLVLQKGGQVVKNIADLVNVASGRGTLGNFTSAASYLNGLFFSPRLIASRLTLINPYYYIKLDPYTRMLALKSFFGVLGTGATILGLAGMAGAKIGKDPRSADFGKIQVGNTRIDIWGGLQQYVRALGQIISGQYISTTTGKLTTLGQGYKPMTRKDILLRFMQSKLGPIPSAIATGLSGVNSTGQPIQWPNEIAQRFIPMVWQDTYDLYKNNPESVPFGLLSLFGMGMQTYSPTTPSTSKFKTTTGKFQTIKSGFK